MKKTKKELPFTPVDLRGHKTQDDFEMNENFGIIILGDDKKKTEDRKPLKDRGDSFLVGELGD